MLGLTQVKWSLKSFLGPEICLNHLPAKSGIMDSSRQHFNKSESLVFGMETQHFSVLTTKLLIKSNIQMTDRRVLSNLSVGAKTVAAFGWCSFPTVLMSVVSLNTGHMLVKGHSISDWLYVLLTTLAGNQESFGRESLGVS